MAREPVTAMFKNFTWSKLRRFGTLQTRAAEVLSLQRTYLARLIKQMGIR